MLAVGLGCGVMVVNVPAASASPHDGSQADRPGHAAGHGADHRWWADMRTPPAHGGPAGESHGPPGLDAAAALSYHDPGSAATDGHGPPAWARAAWRQPQSIWNPTATAEPPSRPRSREVHDLQSQAKADAAIRPTAVPPQTAPPATPSGSDSPRKTRTTAPTTTTTVARAAEEAAAHARIRRTTPPTTVPSTPSPLVEPVVIYRSAPTVAEAPFRPAAPSQPSRATRPSPPAPAVKRPAAPEQTFPGAFGEPMVLARGAWQGLSLRAATELKLPISLVAVVAVFLLVQALVDRRDPKVAAAPERGTDDTVGFE